MLSSPRFFFQAISLKLCTYIISILNMCMCFWQAKKWLWTKLRHLGMENFEVKLQYGVASLCNQFLSGLSSNQFETVYRCCKHIEHVHVTFCGPKNNFWQIYSIFDLDNFEVSLQHRVASLCNLLPPGFSSKQLETLHRCWKHFEQLHVIFCRRKNNFGQNYGIWTWRIMRLSKFV